MSSDPAAAATSDPRRISPLQLEFGAIDFFGRQKSVLYQTRNGACPLLAICNVLSLSDRIVLEPGMSEENLTDLVAGILSSNATTQEPGVAAPSAETLRHVKNLGRFLNVNVIFTRIDGFEDTPQRSIFTLLDIPLYHGWIVEQDTDVANAIGLSDHDTLKVGLRAHMTKENSLNHNAVDSGAATATATLQDPPDDRKWQLVSDFLKTTAIQLTATGVKRLQEAVGENELCVFFQNNHFNTMFKKNGKLYLLATDVDYKGTDAAWIELNCVNWGQEILTSGFMPIVHPTGDLFSLKKNKAKGNAQSSKTSASHSKELQNKFGKQIQRNRGGTQKKMNLSTGSSDDDTQGGSSRKRLPKAKVYRIKKLVKELGGKKIMEDMAIKTKDLADLRSSLDDKSYDETVFTDWFEVQSAEEIADRLDPLSVEGKLSLYAFTGVPKIIDIIRHTSSNSSESLSDNINLPLHSDSDNKSDEVNQSQSHNPRELDRSSREHREVTEEFQKDTSAKNADDSQSHKHPLPPKGSARNTIFGQRTRAAVANTRASTQRTRTAVANRRGVSNCPYDLRSRQKCPYKLRSSHPRINYSGKAGVSGKRPKRAGRPALSHPRIDHSGKAGVSGKRPKRAVLPALSDNVPDIIANDEQSQDGTSNGHVEDGNMPEMRTDDEENQNGAANDHVKDGKLPAMSRDKSDANHGYDTERNNLEDEQSSEQFIGYEHHKVSFKDLKKESLRFKSMFTTLTTEQYLCILLNPDHFDTFIGVGLVPRREVKSVIDRYLVDKRVKEMNKLHKVGPYELQKWLYKTRERSSFHVDVLHLRLGDNDLIHAFTLGRDRDPEFTDLAADLDRFKKKLSDSVGTYLAELVASM